MARVATALAVEALPASFGGIINCVRIARHEVIERRIRGKLSALIRRYGARQVGPVWRAAENLTKRLLVFRKRSDFRHSSIDVRLAHFAWVDDRKRRLVFKGLGTSVPELTNVIQRVHNRRSVALALAGFNPDRNRPSVGESMCRVMAGTASKGAINR